MIETQSQAIDRWRNAAKREAQAGNTALSITYSNMAWLLVERDTWLPQLVKTAGEQVREYLNAIADTMEDFDDVT